MTEIKWDIKRGADIYRAIYDKRLKGWIVAGKIKTEEVIVWRSGFSGWRKPEELEELKPFFKRWEEHELKKLKKKKIVESPSSSKKKIENILIIDDEKELCFLLRKILHRKKYNVSIANTKKEALSHIKKELPDLVFLDLKLADENGMNILPKIKKTNPNIIVNIISAYGSEETREEAKKKEAYNFIDKPFTEEDILNSMK